jgi:hypothetical protein
MFTIVIVTVHYQLAVLIDEWTWMHHVSMWGSIVLWFLFLMAYGAMPMELSTDLFALFLGAVANAPFFWVASFIVPLMCVLPSFAARQLQRYLRPRYYQVVQEIAARERRGEEVYEGVCAPEAPRQRPQLASVMARASRLIARTAAKRDSWGGGGAAAAAAAAAAAEGGAERRGSRHRYSGFVPPYEAKSRVFDSSELRASAAVAGYSISTTGETGAPPASLLSRGATASGTLGSGILARAGGGGGSFVPPAGAGSTGAGSHNGDVEMLGAAGSASGGALAASAAGGQQHQHQQQQEKQPQQQTVSPPTLSNLGPSGSGAARPAPHFASAALARALGGMGAPRVGHHRRTASAGAVLAGYSSLTASPMAGGGASEQLRHSSLTGGDAAGAPSNPLAGYQIARLSLGSAGAASGGSTRASLADSLVAAAAEESSYAGNPVLAQLELEFEKDPRRHKKLSILNVASMPRCESILSGFGCSCCPCLGCLMLSLM